MMSLARWGLAACLSLSPVVAGAENLPRIDTLTISDTFASTAAGTGAGAGAWNVPPPSFQTLAEADTATTTGLTKERKALYLNLGVGAAVLAWGALAWDWGSGGPRFQNEGWFGRDTGEGGMDKLGHMFDGYALSHIFAGLYNRWNFTSEEAARYGAYSSIGVMGLVEVGDAFSDEYGFSYQDMFFNVAGAALGYVLWTTPELARKVDFRVEYNPFLEGEYQVDLFTDYNRHKYLIALKGDGFDFITNPVLQYLELHFGFYARNYDEFSPFRPEFDPRERHAYVGIGLNVGKLLHPYLPIPIFTYLQPPYTYIPFSRRID